MLEDVNSILGIIVSFLALMGLGSTVAYYIVKSNKQKVNDSGIANNSDGDAANMSGCSVGGLNVNGNNNTVISQLASIPSGDEEQVKSIVDMKSTCQILFIDDDKMPSVIKPLKKSGWKNIKKISDTANLDAPEIRNANIIFVDIIGVGKALQFKNEGVGLAAAIKRRYPQKGVVIYSATPEHKLFDPDLDILDGRLEKFAEPIQFSNMIEKYGRPEN